MNVLEILGEYLTNKGYLLNIYTLPVHYIAGYMHSTGFKKGKIVGKALFMILIEDGCFRVIDASISHEHLASINISMAHPDSIQMLENRLVEITDISQSQSTRWPNDSS